MTVTFNPSKAEIPSLPAEALRAPEKEIPFMMLFLHLPSIQGWCEPTHRAWAKRSIELIKDNDPERRYAEIYEGWDKIFMTGGFPLTRRLTLRTIICGTITILGVGKLVCRGNS